MSEITGRNCHLVHCPDVSGATKSLKIMKMELKTKRLCAIVHCSQTRRRCVLQPTGTARGKMYGVLMKFESCQTLEKCAFRHRVGAERSVNARPNGECIQMQMIKRIETSWERAFVSFSFVIWSSPINLYNIVKADLAANLIRRSIKWVFWSFHFFAVTRDSRCAAPVCVSGSVDVALYLASAFFFRGHDVTMRHEYMHETHMSVIYK